MNGVVEAEEIYKSKSKDFGLLAKAFLNAASGQELIDYLCRVEAPDKFAYLVRKHFLEKIRNLELKINSAAQNKLIKAYQVSASKAIQFHAKNLFDLFAYLSSKAQLDLFKTWVMSDKPIERIKGYNCFSLVAQKNIAEKYVYKSAMKYSDRRGTIQLMLHGNPIRLNRALSTKIIWSLDKHVFSWRVRRVYLKRLIEKLPNELKKFRKISFLTYLVGCAHIKMDPGYNAVMNWVPEIKDKKELRITLFCLGKSGNIRLLKAFIRKYHALESKLPEQYLDPVRDKMILDAIAKYESEFKEKPDLNDGSAAV